MQEFLAALEEGAIMGRFPVEGMRERLLSDARKWGRLMIDEGPRDQLEGAAFDVMLACKLLVLAEDRAAAIGEEPGK